MSPRILRLVIAFLAGFVLLSLLPALPDALTALERLPDPAPLGDILLGITAGLCSVLLVIVVRRRKAGYRQAHAFQQALARQPAVRAPTTAVARRPQGAAVEPARSELETRIRCGARKGERLPALARRHGLSIDAIRTALGEPRSAPAASRGSSFRSRQQSVPAARSAAAIPVRRTPYRALA
jgi:hypothetical protein